MSSVEISDLATGRSDQRRLILFRTMTIEEHRDAQVQIPLQLRINKTVDAKHNDRKRRVG